MNPTSSMATLIEQCLRIVDALEDLVAQEAVALRDGEFSTLIALADRAAPLVDFLGATAGALSDRRLRERIMAVYTRRADGAAQLAEKIRANRVEMATTHATQRTVARIAPVYGRSLPTTRQLSAVG